MSSTFIKADQLTRQQWWGYTDLGPVQIPPQPPYEVFYDRADNVTKWYLSFDPAIIYPDGLGTIVITQTIPAPAQGKGSFAAFVKYRAQTGNADPTQPLLPLSANNVVQPIFEEPYIPNMPQGYAGKLFVRNGVLGVDIFATNDPRFKRLDNLANANGEQIFALPLNGLVGFGNQARQIIWSDNTTINSPAFVAWIGWNVVQTPNPPNVNSMANLSNPKADV